MLWIKIWIKLLQLLHHHPTRDINVVFFVNFCIKDTNIFSTNITIIINSSIGSILRLLIFIYKINLTFYKFFYFCMIISMDNICFSHIRIILHEKIFYQIMNLIDADNFNTFSKFHEFSFQSLLNLSSGCHITCLVGFSNGSSYFSNTKFLLFAVSFYYLHIKI